MIRNFILFLLIASQLSAQSLCRGTDTDQFTYVPPPAAFSEGQRSLGFDITFTGYSTEAQEAFEFAASIWSSLLHSEVPVKIQAHFTPLLPGLLGITLPNGRKDFPDAPVAGRWYPSCLANALSGTELNPGEADMDIWLNSTMPWYFGTDGNCPSGKFDFATIVLHETGHGLGFLSLANVSGGTGSFGLIDASDFPGLTTSFPFPDLDTLPAAYDDFLISHLLEAITDTASFPNPSTELAGPLTGAGATELYFAGSSAVSANNGELPMVYTPASFALGSSILHLDEAAFDSGPNSLMTPFAGTAEATHDPGPLVAGILKDLGWKVNDNVGLDGPKDKLSSLLIYPNPASDVLFIEGSRVAGVTVYDPAGRIQLSEPVPSQAIGISDLPPGLYLIQWTSEGRLNRSLFCKQ